MKSSPCYATPETSNERPEAASTIMNDLKRDIRAGILRALKAARGPMPEGAVKQHVRNLFAHVAFTDADLQQHLADLEAADLICGTSDEITGPVWDLTLKGKTRALQLR
jgi:hypothetical protein